MPNLEIQNQDRIRRENLKRVQSLVDKSEYFAAKNLTKADNAAFAEYEEYNLETAKENVMFIDRMLSGEGIDLVELTEEQRAALRLQKNREQNALMLNTGKFTGDSREMQAVKMHVEGVENLLRDAVNMETYVLDIIAQQYQNAIDACRYYLDNKHPWFESGQKRYDLVKETLERVTAERNAYVEAVRDYRNGVYGEEVDTPWKLLSAHLAAEEAYQTRKAAFEADCIAEGETSRQWMEDMMEERDFNAFFEDAKQKNPYVTEEDAKYIFFNQLIVRYEDYDKEQDGEPKPIFKDFGAAAEARDVGLNLHVAKSEDYSRRIAPIIRFVKRKKDGAPLNEAEAANEEKNELWIKAYREYYEAKAANRDNPTDEVKADYEVKRKNLWLAYKDYLDEMQGKLFLLSSRDMKEDKGFFERLILRDIGLAKAYYGITGVWSEMYKEDIADYIDEYAQEHPTLLSWITMLGKMKFVDTQFNYQKHKMNTNMDVSGSSNFYKMMMDVVNDPEATEQEKEDARAQYEEFMQGTENALNGDAEDYARQEVNLKKVAHLTPHERRMEYIRDNFNLTSDGAVRDVIKEQEENGVMISKEAAEMHLLIKNANDFRKTPGFEAFEKEMREKNQTGFLGREFTFNMKLVCRKRDGEPATKEDREREEWNKKWISCFSGEGNKDLEIQMVEQGMKEILDAKIPSPQEITTKTFWSFFEKDPVYYIELFQRALCIDNIIKLGKREKEVYDRLLAENPEYAGKHQLLADFIAYSRLYIKDTYFLDESKNYDFLDEDKYLGEVGDRKEEYAATRFSYFRRFETTYKKMDGIEADRKWREANADVTQEELMQRQRKADLEALSKQGEEVLEENERSEVLYDVGYYLVKRDAQGNPVTPEEARKASHNEKWKKLWKQYLDASTRNPDISKVKQERQKETALRGLMLLYEAHIKDLMSQPFPEPKEVDTPEKLRELYRNDAFVKTNMNHLSDSYFNVMKSFFPQDMKIMEGKYPEFKEARRMMQAINDGDVDGYNEAYNEFTDKRDLQKHL